MPILEFEPLDTLFFKDGRPFNQGEGTAGVESRFLPSPETMLGASRAAWARDLGWNGKGAWSEELLVTLGGANDELENLRFTGPLLEYKHEIVFPLPASLLGVSQDQDKDTPQDCTLLSPGTPMQCDLGKEPVCLPQPHQRDDVEGRKLLPDWWLKKEGIEKVLHGEIPENDSFVHQSELWSMEPKVGISIDRDTDTVEQGMLYSVQHVRLSKGVKLLMQLTGENIESFPDNTQVPLGGEARSSWLKKREESLSLPALADLKIKNGLLRYTIHVITPLNPVNRLKAGGSIDGLPGKLVSACLPRVIQWGGWDSINLEPRPMETHLAPGSVLFMETDESQMEAVKKLHGTTIGKRHTRGFGLILVGRWNNLMEGEI